MREHEQAGEPYPESEEQRVLHIEALLYHAPVGLGLRVLERFSGYPAQVVEEVLFTLEYRNRLIWRREDVCDLAYKDEEVRQRAIAYFAGDNTDERFFSSVLSCAYRGDVAGFLKKSLLFMHREQKRNDFMAVRRIYELFTTMLMKIRVPLDDLALCKMVINIGHSILIRCHNFPWRLQFSFAAYLKLRGVAFAIHDQRSLAKLNLAIGYLKVNNFTLRTHFSYIDYIKKGLSIAHDLGDEDIIHKFQPFNCFLSYLEGSFIKAINYSYNPIYRKNINTYKYLKRVVFVYSALSALMLGEHDVAVNILENGRHNAAERKSKYDVMYYQAMIAYIYLLKNDNQKALHILNEILESPDFSIYTYSGIWSVRLLAYYHYREGRLPQAYAYYKNAMRKAVQSDVVHFGFLTSHFLLELLAAFELGGFSPVGNAGLEENLTFALESSSSSLRAIGLRIFSHVRARTHSWHDDEARQALLDSIRVFRALSTPVELAKSLFVAVLMHQHCGSDVEARICLREALDIQARYNEPRIPEEIRAYLEHAPLEAAERERAPEIFENLPDDSYLFRSKSMQRIQAKVEMLAPKETSVLILGESGVGKEQVARRLYELSGQNGKFIAVNMASIPEELFESEFYGHEKGSFTGAVSRKPGLLELADGGTLFLDEVGDIPPRIQVKLLRVLQEREFMRVGGTKLLTSSFRLVAATNKNLEEEVKRDRFREDLYYRINVVSLRIPPLRERDKDIVFIAEYFQQQFARQYSLVSRKFSGDDLDFFLSYAWPGNVRELKNYIERYVLLSDHDRKMERLRLIESQQGTVCQTNAPFQEKTAPPAQAAPLAPAQSLAPQSEHEEPGNLFFRIPWPGLAHLPSLDEIKKQYFEYAYVQKNGVISGPEGVARTLGISKVTAYAWAEQLQLKEKYVKRIVRSE